jgi:hypothetical protein
MSRSLIFSRRQLTQVGRAVPETIQVAGSCQPHSDAIVPRAIAVTTPTQPVVTAPTVHQGCGLASIPKAYPLSMIRSVLRNNPGGGSAADLQLLRSTRWPH